MARILCLNAADRNMNASANKPISAAELESLLQARESGALLVPARILRRVLKQARVLTVFGQRVTRYTCVMDRETLLRLADRDELGLPAGRSLPARLILFAHP